MVAGDQLQPWVSSLEIAAFRATRKPSHNYFQNIFAPRISLKQKPFNPNSISQSRSDHHRFSHPPVLVSNQGAVVHRSLPGSNFPGQETSKYGETGLPVLLRAYGYCNGGFPTEDLSGSLNKPRLKRKT